MTEKANADSASKLVHLQNQVIENAKWVNNVLGSGTVVMASIVLFKLVLIFNLVNSQVLSWGGLTFSADNGGLIVLIALFFTTAHYYCGVMLLSSSIQALRKAAKPHKLGREVFDRVIESGGIYMRGLMPRTTRFKGSPRIYRMELQDPSTLVACGAVVLVLLAITPWSTDDIGKFLTLLFVAAFLAAVNW